MAEETKEKTTSKQIDFFEKRRNFNPRNAKELFGDKWIDAMNAVSKAGGYGVEVTEEHADLYERHLFGGFAIPQGEEHADTRARINAALGGIK